MNSEQIYQEWVNGLSLIQQELVGLDIDESAACYDSDEGTFRFLEIPASVSRKARQEFYPDGDDFVVYIPSPPRQYRERLYLEQRRVVITPTDKVYCKCKRGEHIEGDTIRTMRTYHTGCHYCGEQAYIVESADHANLSYGYGCRTLECPGEIISKIV